MEEEVYAWDAMSVLLWLAMVGLCLIVSTAELVSWMLTGKVDVVKLLVGYADGFGWLVMYFLLRKKIIIKW